ncbi:MAG: hypothetical protein ACSLEL_01645 [Candidatus Malihini olakiniferum]
MNKLRVVPALTAVIEQNNNSDYQDEPELRIKNSTEQEPAREALLYIPIF